MHTGCTTRSLSAICWSFCGIFFIHHLLLVLWRVKTSLISNWIIVIWNISIKKLVSSILGCIFVHGIWKSGGVVLMLLRFQWCPRRKTIRWCCVSSRTLKDISSLNLVDNKLMKSISQVRKVHICTFLKWLYFFSIEIILN